MRRRILIVDDEESVLKLIAATLGYGEQYELVVARDGLEALAVAQQTKPDLVILDILMPKLDGRAVCRALKTNPATSQAKVLILTALAHDADRQRALGAGADDFLTKPFSPTMLLLKVAQMLGSDNGHLEPHLPAAEEG